MKTFMMVVLMTCIATAPAMAGGLGVFGSYWDPSDADGDFGLGARLHLFSVAGVGLELRGSYFEFSESEGGVSQTLEVIPLEAALIYAFGSDQPIQAYAGGGGGYYMLDLEWSGPLGTMDPDVDDEIGWFVLGGLSFDIAANLNLFLEAKYTWLEIDEIGGFATTQDDSLDGFGANAGLMLVW